MKEHYKLVKVGYDKNELENLLNDMYVSGWEFVGFVPLLSGGGVFGKQQVLFKRKK